MNSETIEPNAEHEGMPGVSHHGMMMVRNEMSGSVSAIPPNHNSDNNNAIKVSVVKGVTTLGDKTYSPNHLKIKVGFTVLWTNDDSNMHTVTSGTPNSPDPGASFDSGLLLY